MSKSPTQTGTNTTTTTNAPPQYVQDAQQALLAMSANLNLPFMSQTPQYALAGFTPDQTMAFDLARAQAQGAYTTPPATVGQYGSTTAAPASATTPTLPAAAQATAQQAMAALTHAVMVGDPAMVQAALAQVVKVGQANQAAVTNSTAAQLAPGEISPFLNPYTTDVVDTTQQQLGESNDKVLAAIRARQGAEGAYGGNRGALQESEQNRNYGNTLAATIAQLYNTGWNKAADLASGNAGLRQQTGLANQQAANTIGLANAAAQNQFELANQNWGNQVGLANAANQQQAALTNAAARNTFALSNQAAGNQANMFNAGAQNAASLANAQLGTQVSLANAAGTNQMAALQAQLAQQTGLANAGYQQQSNLFNANQPLAIAGVNNTLQQAQWQQQMQALQALLGTGGQQQQFAQQGINVPFTALQNFASVVPSAYGTSGTTNQPIYGANTLQTIASLAPLGIAGAQAAGVFSDKTMKKDMAKMGKDPRTDLDMYQYRYKGAPPGSPKQIGPMAQQVEKKYPGSTGRAGGKMYIKGPARQLLGI